ncbi:MAG: hypothetical protein IKN38_04805 [Clostridia bacterium]|nr:hypothetical protein [Clostridia bacterium]
MKKIIVAVLALVMVLALVSCGNSALKDAAGTYGNGQTKFVGDEEWQDTDDVFVLNDNGKGVHKSGDYEYELEWNLEGENFTMKETFLGLTNDYTGTLKDGKLDMFNGDPNNELTCEYVFSIQK